MDIRRFDLNLLVLFDRLYQERNLSAAARALGLSQPAASASLKRLRDAFSDPLFISTGRGMQPTPFADEISRHIEDVVATVDNKILHRPTFDPSTSNRVFTLTTSDIGVLIFIPPILERLRSSAPNTRLRCLTQSHAGLKEDLERGRIDLAVGYFPDLTGPDIITQDLFDHPFTCIVRTNHPSINDTLSLDQFLAADHLVVIQTGRSQEIFESRMAELNLPRKVLLQLPHYMSVPHLIACSDMISVVPQSLGLWNIDAGLKLLEPPMDIPLIELKQHWHRRRNEDPGLRWFRDIVAQELEGRDPSRAMSADYAKLITASFERDG